MRNSTSLNILDTENNDDFLPVYLRLAREISKRLAVMKIGDQLVPERQLCVELGVSRKTLRHALEYFHKNGFLEARRNSGTRLVKEVSPMPPSRMATNRLIGLVVPSVQFPHISRIVQGAEECTTDNGFHLTVAHDHNDIDRQLRQLTRMQDSGVGGMGVYADSANIQRAEFSSVIRNIHRSGMPLVMMDRYLPHVNTAAVLSDNFQGMYLATQHMIEAGYVRIGLLSFGPEGTTSDHDRRKGFLAALQDAGLASPSPFELIAGTVKSELTAQKLMKQHLKKSRGKLIFDSLVCMQSNMAYGAYLALMEAGLRIPEDVGLIGYDKLDEPFRLAAGLDLTVIEQPLEQIGYKTVEMLIHRINNPGESETAPHVHLKPSIILGTSCRTKAITASRTKIPVDLLR